MILSILSSGYRQTTFLQSLSKSVNLWTVISETIPMFGNIEIINPDALVQMLDDYSHDKMAQLSSKDFRLKERRTRPIDGFKFPEKFPECCATHKRLLT